MKNPHGQSVLILGAGPGGTALLELFLEEVLINVIGVVDDDPNALGISLAKEKGIPVFHDIEEALEKSGSCMVFNLTKDETLSEVAARWVGASGVLGGPEAKLIWQIISRLKTMQEDLWENQIRMQAVISNVREGIISIDPKGIIENANPASELLFGYESGELIGQNVKVLMPEPNHSMHDTYLRTYHRTGRKHVIGNYREVVGLTKSGKHFPLEINIAEMEFNDRKHFVGLVRDITGRKQAEEKMTQLALYDHLTGLPNRILFHERLESARVQAHRNKSLVALLFIDLDGFKAVNDSLGHHVGDLLLKEVSHRLKNVVRESDTVARMGGDEYTVILTNIKEVSAASQVAEKIITSLNKPITLDGNSCSIGASIGLAVYPDHAEDLESLISNADSAMYQAKANGKNSCVIFS